MNQSKFIAATGLGMICQLLFCISIPAQVFSSNIVGYINLSLYPGDNFIADQLSSSNNTLDAIFNPSTPEGTAFTEWNPATGQFLPISTYDTNSGWSINYALDFGEGGLLHSVAPFTNTFFGSVWPGYGGVGAYVPPLITSSGLLLLSCLVPLDSATFYDVVGRQPQNGESVSLLNAVTQQSTLTTFENGVWSNGDPLLDVGESAFFYLEPAPEPGILSLLGGGAILAAAFQRKRLE